MGSSVCKPLAAATLKARLEAGREVPVEGHRSASLGSQSEGSRRRALLVGVQYDNRWQLDGTTYDVLCMAHVLISRAGFLREDVVILTDRMYDAGEPLSMFPGECVQLPDFTGPPTHGRIIEQIKRWDLPQAQAGDSFFFHFSGHGIRRERTKGDEEGLVPCEGGTIWGRELEDLVLELPAHARMHVFLDCCHASDVLKLPYIVDFNAQRNTRHTSKSFVWYLGRLAEMAGRNFSRVGHVVQLSACSSTQRAHVSDRREPQEEPGFATYLFLQAVKTFEGEGVSLTEITYQQVMDTMHNMLAEWLTFKRGLRPLLFQHLQAEMIHALKDYKVQELKLGSVHAFDIKECMCL